MKSRFFIYLQIFAIALLAGILLLFANLLSFYSHKSVQPADCIVVFGAAVWPGYYGPVASHALSDRTLAAIKLYKKDKANCIILSGADSIYGAHEVDIMTDILLKEGIPESIIELDRNGTNTLKTIENLSKDKSYILVSNDFHLARIGLLAQRSGLYQEGFQLYVAQYNNGRYNKEPYFIFREMMAWIYYFFTTII